MTKAEAVKLIDPKAKFFVWSDGPAGWVKGEGWETKLCSSEDLAWQLASEMLAATAFHAISKNDRDAKIIDAMVETQRLIDREMRYMEQHRNQNLIRQSESHLAKLRVMLTA